MCFFKSLNNLVENWLSLNCLELLDQDSYFQNSSKWVTFAVFINIVPIVAKLWFMPVAKEIHTIFVIGYVQIMKGSFFIIKKNTSLKS